MRATVTLVTKPGCHLCDEARPIVLEVVDSLDGAEFVEKSILDDTDLYEQFVEEIPVVLINNRVHNIWRVDADRLRAAILEVTA
ncbi:MAG TPA: glutaredoxin family protein [Galbitalea sp.]|nr:glutaredoxin family protein [Galbitalea sp.]